MESILRWRRPGLVEFVLVQLVGFFLFSNIQSGLAKSGSTDFTSISIPCNQVEPTSNPLEEEVDRLCGEIIFLKDLNAEKYYLGLQVCGKRNILIFKVRPRELHQYYQFRNPKIGGGATISTNLGDFNRYITNFDNYVPINNCQECGIILAPTPRELIFTPVGTQNLIFPTATFVVPTVTLSQTPTLVTPSPAPTLSHTFTAPPPTPSITPSLTPFARATKTTPFSTTIQPPLDNPTNTTNNTTYIWAGAGVALILMVSIGYLYLRRRL